MARIFKITKASAVHLAKWRVKERADSPATGFIEKMALNSALSSGKIEEIFNELESLGFSVSGDEDNPTHRQWLEANIIQRAP